jgi:hypothetical protein
VLAGIRDRPALLWLFPALLALVYLITLFVRYGSVIRSIDMDSDVSIAPVIAKLAGQAPAGSHVVLGNHPYYEEYLFMRATAGLSFYRQLWNVAPLVWTGLGFALLGWSVRRAFDRVSAVLVCCAVVCLGYIGMFSFLALDWHGLTVVHTIIVAAAFVWLTPRAADISWGQLASFAVLLGLVSALPTASDQLFFAWALIPLLLASGVMAWRGAGRLRATLPAFAILTTVVAVVAGAIIAHSMRSSGVVASAFPITFAVPANLINNIELLVQGWMLLGGGNFFGQPVKISSTAVVVSGVLLLAALWLGLRQVRRAARAAGPRPSAGERLGPDAAYLAFWTSSLLIQSVAFVLSSAPVDTLSSRYVLAGYVAIAALLPLLVRSGARARIAVSAAVCLFAASAAYQLIRNPLVPNFSGPAQAAQLTRFAAAHDVRYGYSGYWDAADLTWLTKFKLQVFPVQANCGSLKLCATPAAGISTWYAPRAGVRSMLIADPNQPGLPSIDPALGKPIATTRIGSLTVAVFPFDLASKF